MPTRPPAETGAATTRRANAAGSPQPPAAFNWFRFWVRALVAMLVFNVVAGLVTWFFIFPHLHPAR